MAERHYSVQPIDFDGETFTVEGLAETLAAVHERFAGKLYEPPRVSPSLSLGGGAAIVATEAGRVMIVRDDVAKAQAQMREAADKKPDGRTRQYRAEVHIGRVIRHDFIEATADTKFIADGLMGVMFKAAMFVQETLGDVPDCMTLEAVEKRERSIRAQLSRAGSGERELTTVHFPSVERGSSFELPSRLNERYRVGVVIYLIEPTEEEFIKAPRRQR